jgi:hypothetical protein
MESVMGWLDANDYDMIASMASERVGDLLSSTEIAIESAAITDQRGPTECAHFCAAGGCTLGHLPV